MSMQFLRTLTFTAFLALILLVLGCAADDDGPDSSPRRRVTWMRGVDLDRAMIEELVAEFEQLRPDIDVDMVWVPGVQYETKLKTLIAAGRSPDILIGGDVWVAYLLPFLYDLSDFLQRDAKEMGWDDFYPELQAACHYQGRCYFLPRFFNISLLYYNRAIFDEAGEPYPTAEWTWGDYVTAGKRLTQRGPDSKVRIWGSHVATRWWGEWLIYVRQAGGRMFNEELTRCLLDEDAAIRGMSFYVDKIYRHQIAPRPGRGPEREFASGVLAMDWGGHTGNWRVYNSLPDLDWDIEILPAGPVTRNGGEVAIHAVGIAKTSQDPEAAWEFLKFLVSPGAIRKQVEAGYLSVRRSIAEELLFSGAGGLRPRNSRAAYEALKYARPIPQSPDYNEIAIDIIQPEIDLLVERGGDPAEACRRAARAANDFLRVIGKAPPQAEP